MSSIVYQEVAEVTHGGSGQVNTYQLVAELVTTATTITASYQIVAEVIRDAVSDTSATSTRRVRPVFAGL